VHWLWGYFIPGRWYLLLLALAILSVFAIRAWGLVVAPITLALLFIGGSGLLALRLHWRSFSLSFVRGEKSIWERHGFEMITERRINMSMVGTTEFQQTLFGHILDYGSLSVGALGGPYEWENLGQFRTLRRIIESQGEWLPPPRINFLTILINLLRQIARLTSRLLANVQLIVYSLEWERRIIVEHLRAPSYLRFLNFSQRFLFPQNTYRHTGWVLLEHLRSTGFTDNEVRIYLDILRTRRLIVSDFQGRTYRHKRIQTPEDIRKSIPVTWFRKAIAVL
jgi:hypothetical protein